MEHSGLLRTGKDTISIWRVFCKQASLRSPKTKTSIWGHCFFIQRPQKTTIKETLFHWQPEKKEQLVTVMASTAEAFKSMGDKNGRIRYRKNKNYKNRKRMRRWLEKPNTKIQKTEIFRKSWWENGFYETNKC